MTIKEVAKLSGVGTSTVSRYLNGGSVSSEKAEIIKNVIKEYNYTPSFSASALRGKSKKIVVIVQRINSDTASRFISGIVERCDEFNLTPTFLAVNFDRKKQEEYIRNAIEQNVLGIIVNAFNEEFDYIKTTTELCIVGQQSSHLKNIYLSGYNIYAEMTDKVVCNVRVNRIIFVGVDFSDIEMLKRMEGTVATAQKYNLPFNYIEATFNNNQEEIHIEKGDYYVCATDFMAHFIISNAINQNIKLGVDFFLSGFGNYETSEILNITSVDLNYVDIGRAAVDYIFNTDFSYEIEPKIYYRESTGVKI